MRVSICVGDYATTPYCVPGLEVPVYCMEELCYCLRENAFLLDLTLMNDALVEWIDGACGLRELAKELHHMVHKQGSLSNFVIMILEYVGMYEPSVLQEVEQVLKQGAGLTSIEKRKSRIDYLVKKKMYVSAIRGYDRLLSQWQELEDMGKELPAGNIRAAIYHNKGVACTGLMLYGQAAEAFEKAYRIISSKEHLEAYLAAKRLELSEEEYIAFAAEHPDCFQNSLALEKKLEELGEQWKEHPEYRRLQQRREWRDGSEKYKYYEENERLTTVLKSSYRNSVIE